MSHSPFKERERKHVQRRKRKHEERGSDIEPDYEGQCESCGASPILPVSGLCGPCTFGEAETVEGNW